MILGFPTPVMSGGNLPILVDAVGNYEYNGTTGARSVTINLPVTAKPGDKLLLMATCVNSGSSSSDANIQTISGWSSLANSSGLTTDGASFRFMQRDVQVGDTSWNVTTLSGTFLVVEMQVWRNVSTTLGNRQATQSSSGSTVANQIGSTTAGSSMAIFAFFHRNTSGAPTVTTIPPGVLLKNAQAISQPRSARTWSGWERKLSGGATGTRTWAVTNNDFSVMMLQEMLRP